MSSADHSPADPCQRELTASLDLLNGLTVTDRIHLRSAVEALSRAIDEIRTEQVSVSRTDPESHIGPLLADRVRHLQELRLKLLFAVVFPGFEFIESDKPADTQDSGNIVVDGVALAHDTLF